MCSWPGLHCCDSAAAFLHGFLYTLVWLGGAEMGNFVCLVRTCHWESNIVVEPNFKKNKRICAETKVESKEASSIPLLQPPPHGHNLKPL